MGRAKRLTGSLESLKEVGLPQEWGEYWYGRSKKAGILPMTLVPPADRERVSPLAESGAKEFLSAYWESLAEEDRQEAALDPLLDTWLEQSAAPWILSSGWRSCLREPLAEALQTGKDWSLREAIFSQSSEEIISLAQATAKVIKNEDLQDWGYQLIEGVAQRPDLERLLLSDDPAIWPSGGGLLPGLVARFYQEAGNHSLPYRLRDSFASAAVFYEPRRLEICSLAEREATAESFYRVLFSAPQQRLANARLAMRQGIEDYLGTGRVAPSDEEDNARDVLARFGRFFDDPGQWKEEVRSFSGDPAENVYLLLFRAARYFNEGQAPGEALRRALGDLTAGREQLSAESLRERGILFPGDLQVFSEAELRILENL